jgi:hypothetical protein
MLINDDDDDDLRMQESQQALALLQIASYDLTELCMRVVRQTTRTKRISHDHSLTA